jgi:hypothetical protein
VLPEMTVCALCSRGYHESEGELHILLRMKKLGIETQTLIPGHQHIVVSGDDVELGMDMLATLVMSGKDLRIMCLQTNIKSYKKSEE